MATFSILYSTFISSQRNNSHIHKNKQKTKSYIDKHMYTDTGSKVTEVSCSRKPRQDELVRSRNCVINFPTNHSPKPLLLIVDLDVYSWPKSGNSRGAFRYMRFLGRYQYFNYQFYQYWFRHRYFINPEWQLTIWTNNYFYAQNHCRVIPNVASCTSVFSTPRWTYSVVCKNV